MKPLPTSIEQLIAVIGDLSATQQRDYHLLITSRMLEVATMRQVRAIRADCVTSHLCQWLGEAHRTSVLNMIDGHIALRQMRLIRRARRQQPKSFGQPPETGDARDSSAGGWEPDFPFEQPSDSWD